MDRLIEIFRRIAFVTIWIIGGGFAVMFVLLSFHADTFLRQVIINLMALGFLTAINVNYKAFCLAHPKLHKHSSLVP